MPCVLEHLKLSTDVFGNRRHCHAPERTSWISVARIVTTQRFGASARQPYVGTGAEPLIGLVLTWRAHCTEGEHLGASGGAWAQLQLLGQVQ